MKLTHGSFAVQGGKLKGATDRTDYFYFFCPACPDDRVLRILDVDPIEEKPGNEFNNVCRSKARKTLIFGFEIFCEHCGFRDYVKVANAGWQGGKHSQTLGRFHRD